MDGIKFCRKCYKIKKIEEFANNKKRKDGKGSTCKKCIKIINHDYFKRTYKPKRLG